MLQNLQSGVFTGGQWGHTQKGQGERYEVSLPHVCVSVIGCILFGDLGGFYYGILSFNGRSMCVCACVCVCTLGPAYRTLNGSVLVAAKYIHYLFLIYIDPQEKLSISLHCEQIGGGWMDGQMDNS